MNPTEITKLPGMIISAAWLHNPGREYQPLSCEVRDHPDGYAIFRIPMGFLIT